MLLVAQGNWELMLGVEPVLLEIRKQVFPKSAFPFSHLSCTDTYWDPRASGNHFNFLIYNNSIVFY